MEPNECPHCVKATEPGMDRHRLVHCKLVSDAVGWSHSVSWSYCERCIEVGGPAAPDAASHSRLILLAQRVLAGRLKGLGTHNYGAFNLEDTLRKYEGLAGTEAMRDLFRDAVVRWAQNAHDPLPLATVEAEATALAEHLNMNDVLEEISNAGVITSP